MASVFLEEIEPPPYRFGYRYVHLDTRYVSEYYRGRGIASKIFDTVKAWAKEQDVENIQRMTLGENMEARSFYASRGMKACKVQYILEDI